MIERSKVTYIAVTLAFVAISIGVGLNHRFSELLEAISNNTGMAIFALLMSTAIGFLYESIMFVLPENFKRFIIYGKASHNDKEIVGKRLKNDKRIKGANIKVETTENGWYIDVYSNVADEEKIKNFRIKSIVWRDLVFIFPIFVVISIFFVDQIGFVVFWNEMIIVVILALFIEFVAIFVARRANVIFMKETYISNYIKEKKENQKNG